MQQMLILCESTLLSASIEYSERKYLLVSTLKELISSDNVRFCIFHTIKEEWIKEEILYLSKFTFDIRFKKF